MNQVILKAPHTHEGKQYKAGDNITITDSEYNWLLARGIIEAKQPPKQEK